MNKNRIVKLEAKAETSIERSKALPYVWRLEEGKIAIVETPWILNRLKSLGKEIVYSPYIFTAVYVDLQDKEIVEKVEDKDLYLVGLKKPIPGMPEIIFNSPGNEKN